jgi:hypothetical protein
MLPVVLDIVEIEPPQPTYMIAIIKSALADSTQPRGDTAGHAEFSLRMEIPSNE